MRAATFYQDNYRDIYRDILPRMTRKTARPFTGSRPTYEERSLGLTRAEVARKAGVTVAAIRRLEAIGLLKPMITQTGVRIFAEPVERNRFVECAKLFEQSKTLLEICEALQLAPAEVRGHYKEWQDSLEDRYTKEKIEKDARVTLEQQRIDAEVEIERLRLEQSKERENTKRMAMIGRTPRTQRKEESDEGTGVPA